MIVKDSTANKVHNKSKRTKGVRSEPGEAERATPAEKTTQIHNKDLSTLGPRSQRSSLFFGLESLKTKQKGKKRFKGTFF